MTTEEAKEVLMMHSFTYPEIHHPKMKHGFLGSLRPYQGKLVPENFHEVMEALKVLAPSLQQPQVDAKVVHALWGICHLAHSWGVHPNGMLRRNGLIRTEDVETLERWIQCISYATLILLGSKPGSGAIAEAFHGYEAPSA